MIILNGTQGTTTPGLYSNTTFTGTYADGIVLDYTTGLGRISVGTSDGLAFYNAGIATTELMRLDSSGNLGIGTSSPYSKLHVSNGASSTTRISLGPVVTSGDYAFITWKNNTGSQELQLYADAGFMSFYTAATEKMRLDSSGNLGLGVTPQTGVSNTVPFFQIAQTIMSSGQWANNAYYNGSNYIYMTTNYATRYQQIGGQHSWSTAPSGTAGNAITFTQAMTLDANGCLGVGTASPAYSGSAGYVTVNTYGSTASYFVADGGSGAVRTLYGSSNTTGNFGTTTNHPLTFNTSNTERMRIDSSGNFLYGVSSISGYSGKFVIGTGDANGWYSTTGSTSVGVLVGIRSSTASVGTIGATNLALNPDGGNVGIGTTSPSYKLDVIGGSLRVGATSSGNAQLVPGTATNSGYLAFQDAANARQGYIGYFDTTNGLTVAVDNAYPLRFQTNSSERARIDSSGNLLVGTTTYSTTGNGVRVSPAGSVAVASTSQINVVCDKPSSPSQTAFQGFYVNGALQGYINYINPGCSYVNASDQRLKTNIVDAPSALPTISKLKVRSFDWVGHDTHIDYQWIAQEVYDVYPAAASQGVDNPDGSIDIPWGVDPSKLVGLCVKAIQELKAELDELKAKVN